MKNRTYKHDFFCLIYFALPALPRFSLCLELYKFIIKQLCWSIWEKHSDPSPFKTSNIAWSPCLNYEKSGRVEEPRRRAATSISEQLLYHYPWCRTRRTSHACAHRRLQQIPLNILYTFKQSSMFNGVGINCSHAHFACLRASNAATSTFEHSIYFQTVKHVQRCRHKLFLCGYVHV